MSNKKNIFIIGMICIGICVFQNIGKANPRVTKDDNWIMVDGEKYFIKAIGYEIGSRPHQLPWKYKFNEKILRLDLDRIKAAGFNTLRCWSPYPDEVLDIAKSYNFMVIQGIWIDFNKFFEKDADVSDMVKSVYDTVERSKKYDNILFYLVMNEPHPGILEKAGMDLVIKRLLLLRDAVKKADPSAMVSISNCAMADFLPMDIWDITCFNVYPYGPPTVPDGLGFRDYIKWLKKTYAQNKPLIVTEFGLSVSPDGPGKWGYGGNTEKEQAEGDIWMYKNMINAGAAGGSLFIWLDGWWKNHEYEGDENKHDPEPEEWFGILGIKDANSPIEGTPRAAYNEVKNYLKMLVISPHDNQPWNKDGKIDVEIFADEIVDKIELSIENNKPIEIPKYSVHWFGKRIKISEKYLIKGKTEIDIKALDKKGNILKQEKINAVSSELGKTIEPEFKLTADKDIYDDNDKFINLNIKTSKYLDHRDVSIVVFHYDDYGIKKYNVKLDEKGESAVGKYKIPNEFTQGYYGISAGLEWYDNRIGDMKTILVKGLTNEDLEKIIDNMPSRKVIDNLNYISDKQAKDDFKTLYTGDASIYIGKKQDGNNSSPLRIDFKPKKSGGWLYTDKKFKDTINIKESKYLSVIVEGDNSGNGLKFMLIDEDKERWFQRAVLINFDKTKKIVFNLNKLSRDPYDGIKGGNNKPDLDKIKGIAIVLEAKTDKPTVITLKDITVYR